jgi:hypothetical protein
MLDMELQLSPTTTKNSDEVGLRGIRDSLFTLVITTLKESITQSHANWSSYVKIIQYLAKPQLASFITFNYDLAIERALSTPIAPDMYHGFSYDYSTNEVTPSGAEIKLVLKLHGSANWVYCRSCNEFRAKDDYMLPIEMEANRNRLHNEMKCKDTNQFINVLIPPTWSKTNYISPITNVWRKSVQEITQATHLFIMGYSFPRTDLFFDQIMGLALRDSKNLQRIVVVNPDPKVGDIIKEFFESHFLVNRVTFLPISFQQLYKNTHFEMTTSHGMESFIDALGRDVK